jgi:copper chaperone CopZ
MIDEGDVMSTNEYQVTGMSCGHCELSVREEVSQIAGVEDVEVSAQTGRLVVISADTIDDEAVLAAVDEAGYQASRV